MNKYEHFTLPQFLCTCIPRRQTSAFTTFNFFFFLHRQMILYCSFTVLPKHEACEIPVTEHFVHRKKKFIYGLMLLKQNIKCIEGRFAPANLLHSSHRYCLLFRKETTKMASSLAHYRSVHSFMLLSVLPVDSPVLPPFAVCRSFPFSGILFHLQEKKTSHPLSCS